MKFVEDFLGHACLATILGRVHECAQPERHDASSHDDDNDDKQHGMAWHVTPSKPIATTIIRDYVDATREQVDPPREKEKLPSARQESPNSSLRLVQQRKSFPAVQFLWLALPCLALKEGCRTILCRSSCGERYTCMQYDVEAEGFCYLTSLPVVFNRTTVTWLTICWMINLRVRN